MSDESSSRDRQLKLREAEYLWQTSSYIIWPAAARKLLRHLPVDSPTDCYISSSCSRASSPRLSRRQPWRSRGIPTPRATSSTRTSMCGTSRKAKVTTRDGHCYACVVCVARRRGGVEGSSMDWGHQATPGLLTVRGQRYRFVGSWRLHAVGEGMIGRDVMCEKSWRGGRSLVSGLLLIVRCAGRRRDEAWETVCTRLKASLNEATTASLQPGGHPLGVLFGPLSFFRSAPVGQLWLE